MPSLMLESPANLYKFFSWGNKLRHWNPNHFRLASACNCWMSLSHNKAVMEIRHLFSKPLWKLSTPAQLVTLLKCHSLCPSNRATHHGHHSNYRLNQHEDGSPMLWFAEHTLHCRLLSLLSLHVVPQYDFSFRQAHFWRGHWRKSRQTWTAGLPWRSHNPLLDLHFQVPASYKWQIAQQNAWNRINLANYQGNDHCDSEIWWFMRSSVFFKGTCLKMILEAWLRQIAGNWPTLSSKIFPQRNQSLYYTRLAWTQMQK